MTGAAECLAALMLACTSAATGVNPGSLAGDWAAVRDDVGEISFIWYKSQLEYRTFLNGRPGESGEWDLRGDSLLLYGPSGTGRYRVALSGDTLRLSGAGGTRVFVKKAEWRELLIYGNCSASSTLNGEEWSGDRVPAYSVRNLGDGDPATCWAEGAEGPGVGEKIYLSAPGRPSKISISNGYGKSKPLFEKNGRVKAFRATTLAAFNLPGDVTEAATKYQARKCGPTVRLEVKDIQDKQGIPLPFDWLEIERKAGELAAAFEKDFASGIADRSHGCRDRFYQAIILELEIAEVYPGGKHDDACVSELSAE